MFLLGVSLIHYLRSDTGGCMLGDEKNEVLGETM